MRYVYNARTWKSLPGSLCGPAEPKQGLDGISRWLLNSVLKPVIRTSQGAEDIKVAPTGV